jgi:hypothetical protein
MRKPIQVAIAVAILFTLAGRLRAQSPMCPAAAPTLQYPANNATGVGRGSNNSVTVKWSRTTSDAALTANYDIYFGPQGTGCTTLHATEPASSTSWAPPSNEIVDGATYEWKVVAKGLNSCLKPSTCFKFTVANCPTAAPTLSQPANNSTVSPGNILLKWQGVAFASFYEVYVQIDSGPITLAGVTTVTEKTISIEPGHTVHWAVKATASGCTGFISAPFVFNTSCPTILPKLLTPANGATFQEGTSIPFSWTDVDNALGSVFEYSSNGGNTWQTLGERSTARGRSATFAVGTWLWRIRADYPGSCQPRTSAPQTFVVTSTACNNSAPTLVTPLDGTTHTLPLTFTWTAPAAGKTFLIFVSGPNGTSQVGTTTGNSFVLNTLDPGTYQWYVLAKFDNCPDVESARRTVIIQKRTCAQESITLNTPANNATVVSPVAFSWSAIPDATAYRVYASQDGGAPVLLLNTTATSASISLPSGTFKWKVEGLRDGCPPVLSNEGNFIIRPAASCNSNVPPQLQPPVFGDDLPTTTGRSVVLPWIAQTRGSLYRVWLSFNGRAFEDVGVTRDTQLERTLIAGAYRWYVQGFYENCPPLVSPTEEFTVEDATPRCNVARPVIAEPVNGATVNDLRFRISEVNTENRAVRYRFFAIVDRSNGNTETIFLGSSTEPEFEPALQLPPGTYNALVEKSVDECPSAFSDKVTFTIARAQNCGTTPPQLQSPANGALNLQPDIDFIWVPQGSPAVAKYVLFVQSNDGTPTPVAVTNETHARHRVPPGRLRWWVVEFRPGCDPLFSKENVAGVAAPQNCAAIPPVGLQPDDVEEISERGVLFAWTRVANATKYNVWLWREGEAPAKVASTTELRTLIDLAAGAYHWFIEAEVGNCGSIPTAMSDLRVIGGGACGTPGKPRAHVVGRTLSGSPYRVRWTPLAHVKTWELQQSETADFANAQTFLLTDTEYVTTQTIAAGSQEFRYRVRGVSDCSDEKGPYSDVVTVLVVALKTSEASVEVSADNDVVQQLFIPGSETPSSFTVAVDKPWVTANPSSGALPKEGTTITLTSRRDQLNLGGNRATVKVSVTPQESGKLQTNATSVVSFPINVSLVTPVTPSGKSGPAPDSLIFLGVGHAAGQNDSLFESDVRLANLSSQPMKYQINYTPSGTDGTVTGNTTTVEIAPGQTLALDDIMSTVFGLSSTVGMLEARPLTTSTSSGGLLSTVTSTAQQQLLTLGSSRTYNFTSSGTFGQYVPAIPFSKFVGVGKILSLLQVAQSAAYRANFGFMEASGQPVDLKVRAYDIAGHLLTTIPISLQASEHKQIGLLLAANGITDLQDGRVEVEVTSGGGKITAYVSELDNGTNDPFLVSAVEKGAVSANRYVVPGMAHKDLGFAFWVSDLRIYNAGTTQIPATLTFYTEANPSSNVSKQVMLDPGEIEVLDDVVQNLFQQPNGAGGSIVVTTAQNAPLSVSARTYNKTDKGTYGQSIPGVTVAESVGASDRALQVLQVEHSPRFRTYIALTETTGNPARVEVGLVRPDSIATQYLAYDLAGNEYRQINVGDFGAEDAIYNARITVKVISGTGKVTASGSSIDMSTNDPTYIVGQ